MSAWGKVMFAVCVAAIYAAGYVNGQERGEARGWRKGATVIACALGAPQPVTRASVAERCLNP